MHLSGRQSRHREAPGETSRYCKHSWNANGDALAYFHTLCLQTLQLFHHYAQPTESVLQTPALSFATSVRVIVKSFLELAPVAS